MKKEALFLLIISLSFIALNAHDLNSWYYSAIGDEYAFFNFAKQITQGKKVNLFSQDGVYTTIPVLSSFYQAQVMKVFGINHFGWKISSVLIIAFSFFPFYFLTKELFTKRVAQTSLFILASSHYLWAYVHTGYPNIEALFPTITSLFFFVKGHKNNSFLLFFLAGLFAGLGFYTFYSSRVTIIILLLLIFLTKKEKSIKTLLPLLIGFLLLFLPMLIVSKKEVFTKMLSESLISSNEQRNISRIALFFQNIPRSFFAFISNRHPGPYLSGSLLDPLSGILLYAGFLISLISFKKQASRILLVWFMLGLLTVGGFSEFSYTPVSRLHFLLPEASIFTGLSLTELLKKIKKKEALVRGIVLAAIFSLNLYRFYLQSPKVYQASSEAVAIRAFKQVCSEQKTAIIDQSPFPLLEPALASYNLTNKPDLFQSNNIKINRLSRYSCLILTRPSSLPARDLLRKIKRDFPFFEEKKVTDFTKKTEVAVFRKR